MFESAVIFKGPDLLIVRSRHNGQNIFNITWKNTPVNRLIWEDLTRRVKRGHDYSIINETDLRNLTASVNRQKMRSHNYSGQMTEDQVMSARGVIIKEKIIHSVTRMNKHIAEIAQEYDHGRNILQLSAEYNFAPIGLLRGIFLHKRMDASIIYNIFVKHQEPAIYLNGRDREQYLIAFAHDAENSINQQVIADKAARNESLFIEFFRNIGISLYEQSELVAEQVLEHGRAQLTPDILFRDTVYINGRKITWIDYKDYIGTDIKFLYKSNTAQADKYAKKWGLGALCFRHSYIDGLSINSAILLDARVIPVQFDKRM